MIDQVVRKSSRLVDEILSLARIEREHGTIALSDEVDLRELAHTIVDELEPTLRRRRISLAVTADSCSGAAKGNRPLLEIALRNFIENAISFAEPDGTVRIHVETDDDWATVHVHDSGPGVGGTRNTGFQRARALFSTNAGLGLPIVSRIVERHGGSAHIGVSSVLGGAVAVIRLPRKPEQLSLERSRQTSDRPAVSVPCGSPQPSTP
jgi:signal transduction histidine kinase